MKASDFDPYGDGSEGAGTVRNAIDRQRDSAWYTDTYVSADMNGKGGVGLVVDLGAVRPVRAIDLKLVGSGSDFEILTSKKKPTKMKDFRPVVDVTAAGDAITVRMPRARDARFVMVWLTQLPFNGASYAGGIRDLIRSDDPQSFFGLRGGGIGWGLPAAVGAKIALPDRPVVAIVGDGSAMYSCQALCWR